MARTIRFHLDEMCNAAIATALRQRGIDVTTTTEAGLTEAPDDQQLAYAVEQGRVIHTNDPDFLRLHSAGAEHPGIAYCAMESRTLGEIIRMLVLVWEVLEPEDMRNRVEYL